MSEVFFLLCGMPLGVLVYLAGASHGRAAEKGSQLKNADQVVKDEPAPTGRAKRIGFAATDDIPTHSE